MAPRERHLHEPEREAGGTGRAALLLRLPGGRLVVSGASLSGSVGREWLARGGKAMKIRLFLTLGRWKHVQSALGPRLW